MEKSIETKNNTRVLNYYADNVNKNMNRELLKKKNPGCYSGKNFKIFPFDNIIVPHTLVHNIAGACVLRTMACAGFLQAKK